MIQTLTLQTRSKALPNSNYQQIFSLVLESYKKKTGNDLTSNPLLPILETCNSPEDVIALLREQIPGFDSRNNNDSESLSNWLIPTVKVIAAFSGILGESVGSVSLMAFHSTYLNADLHSLVIPNGKIHLYGYRNSSLGEFLKLIHAIFCALFFSERGSQ